MQAGQPHREPAATPQSGGCAGLGYAGGIREAEEKKDLKTSLMDSRRRWRDKTP